MAKKLIVCRGIVGAGKSTLAKQLALEAYKHGTNAIICESDQFFTDTEGNYNFDATKLKQAHQYCREKVEKYMNKPDNVDYGLIIVSNTSTRKWEYEPYLELAKKYRYEVEEIIVGELDKESVKLYAERNTHGVPIDKIMQMAERFEK